MKKNLFFLMLAIMPLTFIACSSDDDDTPNNSSKIVGVWKQVAYNSDGTWHNDFFGDIYYFGSDNTYKVYSSVEDYKNGKVYSSGTYTFDGKQIALNGSFKHDVTFSENENEVRFEGWLILDRLNI
jgi:hypothetical protein